MYDLSRLARNRLDDAVLSATLAAAGVELLSTKEHIDRTPSGQLTHGLLAVVNEYRSISDGLDIPYKMGQKVARGGTVGRAPLGYLNVAEHLDDGREVRSVALDPDRAPFVRRAFELFATGDYGLGDIADRLAAQGFTTRRTPAMPSHSIDGKTLGPLLRNRYYIGKIRFNDTEHDCRHPHLVSDELFNRVQTVFASRHQAGERRRRHPHYLVGSLYCGQCLQEGRAPYRLIFTHVVNHAGIGYDYFFCRGRQVHACTAPFISVTAVEERVQWLWQRTRLPGNLKVRAGFKLPGDRLNLGQIYANANPTDRRLLNQAMFGKFYVMPGGLTTKKASQ